MEFWSLPHCPVCVKKDPTKPLDGAFADITKDTLGLAAVEFAILLPLMLIVVAGLLNIGFAVNAKIQLNTTLSAAGYYAFQNGQALTSSNATGYSDRIKSFIDAELKGLGEFSSSVLFNGSTNVSAINDYYCTSNSSPPSFPRAGSTQSTCSQSITSGKYVTIEVTGHIAAPAPFAGGLGSILNVAEVTHVRVR